MCALFFGKVLVALSRRRLVFEETREQALRVCRCSEARRGTYRSADMPESVPFQVIAFKDAYFTVMLASRWGTTNSVGEIKTRYVPTAADDGDDDEMDGAPRSKYTKVEFQHPDTHEAYYKARHCVDDVNNGRQGWQSLEEEVGCRDWSNRHWWFGLGTSETGAHNLHDRFQNTDTPLFQFRARLAEQLINNADLINSDNRAGVGPVRGRTARDVDHSVMTSGNWMKWSKMTQRFQFIAVASPVGWNKHHERRVFQRRCSFSQCSPRSN